MLPHLHVFDGETALAPLTPRWQPVVDAVPELLGGSGTLVAPRLVSNTVRKESVRTADGDVQDEIKGLVEGCVVSRRLHPWVIESGVVHEGFAEAATIPHGFVELDEEYLLCSC